MRWIYYLIGAFFLILGGIFVTAGDIIVKNGELNVTQNFFVDTNTFFVDSTNNRVGIGESSPSSTLDVVGDIEISGSRLHVNSAGNIGIGTTTPTNGKLEVYGTNILGSVLDRSATSAYNLFGFSTAGTMDWSIGTLENSNGDLRFYSYGTSSNVFFINKTTGNVGIGSTSPNATLYVAAGKTTLADAWTVRSGREIKENITQLNVNAFDFSVPKLYTYKIKFNELDLETNQTVDKLSRERIGLMQDEVPVVCREDNGGVDTYCLLALAYTKIAQLESRIAALGG